MSDAAGQEGRGKRWDVERRAASGKQELRGCFELARPASSDYEMGMEKQAHGQVVWAI